MTLELSKQEAQLLHDLIEWRIENLGPEIHHTRTREYRANLERLRDQLAAVMQRLEKVAAC